ncbi:MAG: hypothetical protein ABJN34_12580 [Litoreibacter sp.]|uniref:hypothetical protein n=1 Tax=Litoreibacter sp. TaxID=1969459 RepID=UPI00329940E2
MMRFVTIAAFEKRSIGDVVGYVRFVRKADTGLFRNQLTCPANFGDLMMQVVEGCGVELADLHTDDFTTVLPRFYPGATAACIV